MRPMISEVRNFDDSYLWIILINKNRKNCLNFAR